MDAERVLTVDQAAEMAGVSKTAVRNWIDNRELPAEQPTAVGRGRSGWRIKEVEVIFGNQDLLHGDKAHPLLVQKAIEDYTSHLFVGIGGSADPVTEKLREQQANGKLRLMAMAPGIVHSKYYPLQGAAGRRVLVGSTNLSERAMSGKQGELLLAYDNHDFI